MAKRSYTWAEGDRETVAISDTFRLASASKMFTTAAIDHLINRGKLSTRTKVYKRMGYFDAKDERAENITVKYLFEPKGGYDHMSNRSVATVYEGYGAIMEECSAAVSLKASASTIAKFAGFY
ncbi:beta-lactamase, partial [Fusarium coicis]